jgi:hypothetical protein
MGLLWDISDKSYVQAGGYLNSSARLSLYGSVGRELVGSKAVGLGVEAGLVTGYSVALLPIAFPYVRFSRGRYSLKVDVLPAKRPILGFQVVRR